MYLFEAQDQQDPTLPGHMIVGSSNLSHHGLKSRNELNVIFHDTDYNEGKALFDKLWDTSIIIADKDNLADFEKHVVNRIWIDKLPTPYAMYLRVLHEYFSINFNLDRFITPHAICGKYSDFEYQTDAIKESLDRIERHNGVMIADVVGLGKSIIASAVAYNLGLPVVIITPPHLESQWLEYSREFGFYPRARVYTSGKIEQAAQHYSNYDKPLLVIIDEAHKYRNPKTHTYRSLHELCQGNKVIQLTATPYNNRPQDIYALLKLFQIPGKSTLRNIDNLGELFEKLIKEYEEAERDAKRDSDGMEAFKKKAHDISKKILNIISPVVIRRSRKDLEAISRYREDLKKQGISFPKVNDPQLLEYDLGEMGELYVNTLETIYAKEGEGDILWQEGVYKAARYQPILYVKEESLEKVKKQIEEEGIGFDFFQRSQRQLANFMRLMLVRRFESSVAAFKQSLESMISKSEEILNWVNRFSLIPIYKRGRLPDIETLLDSSDDIGEEASLTELDEILKEYKQKGLFTLKVDDIMPSFIEDIKTDIEILQAIHSRWFIDNKISADPKLNDIAVKLKEMLDREPERKILIFSEFADTVEYLHKELAGHGLPVFSYTSRKASKKNNKEIVSTNFDAGIEQKKWKDDYKILVATDAISEGYNLHRAGAIFNYDIPYNPTRVIQRVGRINRVNKKVFDELYIYNYFPSVIGEADIKVKRIATIKIRMINAVMGSDTKVLTEDEVLSPSEFNKKFREAESAAEQKSWDTDFREDWEQSKQTQEYAKALNICRRSRIARTEERGNRGVVVFGKRGEECVFKLALNTEEAACSIPPEKALPLFKADKSEAAAKVSEEFEALYQHTKSSLFGNKKSKLRKKQSDAMNKIKGWLNDEAHKREVEYLNLLLEVVKIDGLPDYSVIKREKSCEDLKEKVTEQYLMKIRERASRIEGEQENIILTEELK
jgi:superfamily II DNA or RNA helicase